MTTAARTEPARAAFAANITHPDWPIAVGNQRVEERTDDEGHIVRTEVTVLAETLTLRSGLEVRVVHTVVTEDGGLLTDTLGWYGQDAEGNVWHLGQQTAAYAEGRIVTTAGSWEAGVDGADPTIVLPRPVAATPGDVEKPRPSSRFPRAR